MNAFYASYRSNFITYYFHLINHYNQSYKLYSMYNIPKFTTARYIKI